MKSAFTPADRDAILDIIQKSHETQYKGVNGMLTDKRKMDIIDRECATVDDCYSAEWRIATAIEREVSAPTPLDLMECLDDRPVESGKAIPEKSVKLSSKAAEPVAWIDGFPKSPWSDEWFIAVTSFGYRVVLKSLPEEYAYDFRTADNTYFKKEKIVKWMQFPDSEFKAAIDAQRKEKP